MIENLQVQHHRAIERWSSNVSHETLFMHLAGILSPMQVLMNLCSALGLSSAAGLNAYIPLLTLGVMANRGIVRLESPYDVLAAPWCIGLLAVLLIVEIVVDKVPGLDHVNDVIHTAIRPAAGAVLFASQAGIIHGVPAWVWLGTGLLFGGSVHTAKALARPIVNVTTVGVGAPVMSVIEDLVGTTLSIVSLLAPVLAVVLLGVFGWLLYKMYRRLFVRPRVIRVRAVAVVAAGEAAAELAPAREWDGGV